MDANTGHASGILMACVDALRTGGAPAPLTLVFRPHSKRGEYTFADFNTHGEIVEITKADSKKMQRLAQEGKKISAIRKEDFPALSYWDVYVEVYGSGKRSALGVKRMITTRIEAVAASKSKNERMAIAEELQELVWHLYDNHKLNQTKLAKIRAALAE